MDNRAWSSGASASPPAAPASPSVGYPTAGDPQTATPATKGGAYWFHQMGEELRAILTAASITPDKANLTQLLTALRSAGVFQTTAQFDNSTKVATAAFVQRALGSMANGVIGVAVNTTLTAAHVGYPINLSSGSPITVTLPLAADCATGAMLHFMNTSSGAVTIQRQGADILTGGAQTITSFTVSAGDRASLVRLAGTWVLMHGSAQNKFSAGFVASLTSNGQQPLPSGLIMQWAQSAAAISAGTSLTITLPQAFLNALLIPFATARNGLSAGAGTISATPNGLGAVDIHNNGTGTINGVFVLAFGK